MIRLLKRLDRKAWDLPLPARRVVIAPIAVAVAVSDGVRSAYEHGVADAREGWRYVMDYVEIPPHRTPDRR